MGVCFSCCKPIVIPKKIVVEKKEMSTQTDLVESVYVGCDYYDKVVEESSFDALMSAVQMTPRVVSNREFAV